MLAVLPAPALAQQGPGAAPGMATVREEPGLPDSRRPGAVDEEEDEGDQNGPAAGQDNGLPAIDAGPDAFSPRAPDAPPEPQASAPAPPATTAAGAQPDGERAIDFEANELAYDSQADVITASGNVILRSADRSVRADKVVWNRKSGQIEGTGNVRFVDDAGNQLYTDRIDLTDRFDVGSLRNLLLVLREGGRLAAESGERNADGDVILTRAAYTACDVTGADGCPKSPSWRITARRVVYDSSAARVRFTGAYLELFGQRLLPLPGLSLRTDGGAASGFLMPDIGVSAINGVELSGSYYYRIADNMDATAGAYVFSKTTPMVSGSFRHLTDKGAYQITGYLTESRRSVDFSNVPTSERALRGYIFANGRFQFDPNWSTTFSIRRASDRTFLRRYAISNDDRLRSLVEVERVDRDSYLLIAGYATQTLRLFQEQRQVPLALPMIDYRRRLDDPVLGGKVELHANTLAIDRTAGQSTQRAFASAQWDLRRYTAMGQILQLTALARADIYHSDDNLLTETAIYRGDPGWESRTVALAAADLKWPLAGTLLGGTQVLTPRVQVVATPDIRNFSIPNEDARAIDLEDTNLFSLNRFPGYDRVEDGTRVTYGFDWEYTRPNLLVSTTLGQSFRFDPDRDIFPDGTGLADRVSDVVGRIRVRYRDFLSFTNRFRLDKDNLAVRRNEFDITVGSRRTYAEIGYLRLDRNVDLTIEDLADREEFRGAARVAFARYWSIFGSAVVNLTNRQEDSAFTSDGFDPVRTRLGVAYQDDCLEMGLTWRRDYRTLGDARRGNSFELVFRLRNLGFR